MARRCDKNLWLATAALVKIDYLWLLQVGTPSAGSERAKFTWTAVGNNRPYSVKAASRLIQAQNRAQLNLQNFESCYSFRSLLILPQCSATEVLVEVLLPGRLPSFVFMIQRELSQGGKDSLVPMLSSLEEGLCRSPVSNVSSLEMSYGITWKGSGTVKDIVENSLKLQIGIFL